MPSWAPFMRAQESLVTHKSLAPGIGLDLAQAAHGAGLPSEMMTALLYPKRRVLVGAGDGGLMINNQELETARRMNLNLVVLIMEDQAYGMIPWKQADDGFADWGLTFGNPDFVAYAAAYGARGSAMRSCKLADLGWRCTAPRSVTLVEVVVDPLHLRALYAAAVSSVRLLLASSTTSCATTVKRAKAAEPNVVEIATSAASRPRAMTIRPIRG
jgi:TPP-dependent trihydroxycyclohexane-1,2-dione (THcHDO) dehydratase